MTSPLKVSEIGERLQNLKTGELLALNSQTGALIHIAEDEHDQLSSDHILLPNPAEIDDLGFRRQFSSFMRDDEYRNELLSALSEKNPEEAFKAKLHELDIDEAWYEFHRSMYADIATEWCEKHNLPYSE